MTRNEAQARHRSNSWPCNFVNGHGSCRSNLGAPNSFDTLTLCNYHCRTWWSRSTLIRDGRGLGYSAIFMVNAKGNDSVCFPNAGTGSRERVCSAFVRSFHSRCPISFRNLVLACTTMAQARKQCHDLGSITHLHCGCELGVLARRLESRVG